MKLIVGLGNPGEKYENTRHNVGFFVLDRLAAESRAMNYESSKKGKVEYVWVEIDGEKVELVKPQTFMNESGFSVQYAKKNHSGLNNSDVLVIHDDLDIFLGSYKLQFGKGPKLHNGVKSVEDCLGTKDFWRLRVGIDGRSRKSEVRSNGEEYVLARFSKPELDVLNSLTTQKLIPEVSRWITNPTS
jgi:PTH1 family peptidyl-tRNA hydrolase